MTPRKNYTLEYVKTDEGHGFIITSFSNRITSYGYPSKEICKQAARDITKIIIENNKQITKIKK